MWAQAGADGAVLRNVALDRARADQTDQTTSRAVLYEEGRCQLPLRSLQPAP